MLMIISWSLCAEITVTKIHTVFVLNEANGILLQKVSDSVATADLDEIQAQHHPDKAMCLRKVLQQRIQCGRLARSTLCKIVRGVLYSVATVCYSVAVIIGLV